MRSWYVIELSDRVMIEWLIDIYSEKSKVIRVSIGANLRTSQIASRKWNLHQRLTELIEIDTFVVLVCFYYYFRLFEYSTIFQHLAIMHRYIVSRGDTDLLLIDVIPFASGSWFCMCFSLLFKFNCWRWVFISILYNAFILFCITNQAQVSTHLWGSVWWRSF